MHYSLSGASFLDTQTIHFRAAFPDRTSIVFTHPDLHPSNIMMSSTSTDVLAIIDWHASG
jgi:thiamine kinase-like enzyme